MNDTTAPSARTTTASAPASAPRQFEDPVMARIDRLLTKGFPLLKFPAALEDQFLRDSLDARRRHFMLSGLLALVLYNGFLIVDYLMAPDVFGLAVQLRLLGLTPIGLILILLGTRADWKLVRELPPVLYELIIVTMGLTAALTLAFILTETRGPYAHFYHVGYLVVIMYGNVVTRLRFWYALVFSLAMMAIHILGVLQVLESFPPRLVWPIVTLVGTTALFSLVANYTMERDERRRYLLTLRQRGMVRELTRTYERVQALSHVDGLTGLYNRRHFQEYLSSVWGRAQYDKDLVSMLMIDLDQFKRFTDRYGFQASDECLAQIAQALQTVVRRPEDLIARHAGDEFIVLMPHTSLHQAEQAAERMREAVEALQIRHESSTASRFVTVSVGVACVRADFPLKDAVLVSAAEHALQQAKREGRNRVCVHEMPPAVLQPGTTAG